MNPWLFTSAGHASGVTALTLALATLWPDDVLLAFSDLASVRVALDQELGDLASPLAGVRELAFFPPMTGG